MMSSNNELELFESINDDIGHRTHADRKSHPIEIFYLKHKPDLSNILEPTRGHHNSKYESVVCFPNLPDLIGKSPLEFKGFRKKWVNAVPLTMLEKLTSIANSDKQFDWIHGNEERQRYIQVCNRAIAFLRDDTDKFKGQIIVGIERAGKKIVESLQLQNDLNSILKTEPLVIEAERLYFKTSATPSYGINVPDNIPTELHTSPIAIINAALNPGIIASTFFALQQRGIFHPTINTYNVIASPVVKAWLSQVRIDLGIQGTDIGLYEGGQLDNDLQLKFAPMDPLISDYGVGKIGDLILGYYNKLTDISESTRH